MQFYELVKFFKKKLKSMENKKKQIEMAEKYLGILSPLCERFGFFSEKNILDDYCFYLSDPKKYEEISLFMKSYQENSGNLILRIKNVLFRTFKKNKIKCRVKGRYKSKWSIYKKTQKRGYGISELKDVFAFRVVIEEESEEACFKAMNILHDSFHPIAHRFKDYVNVPKPNYYQSLHTGLEHVVPDLKLPIEVQIRTIKMDEWAEHGIAAHWKYGKARKKSEILKKTFAASIEEESKFIYCFSYVGDLFKLKNGSTVMDFARHIHSSLAKNAGEAIINGETKPMDSLLKDGDIIEIIRKKDCVNTKLS